MALLPGVETDLSHQPIMPVPQGLLIEPVTRLVPLDRQNQRLARMPDKGGRGIVGEPVVMDPSNGGPHRIQAHPRHALSSVAASRP